VVALLRRQPQSVAVNKGFTLIELIIYIGIVATVLVLATGFAWNIIQGSVKTACYREVQQNARFAMEKITRAIRAGQNPTTTFSVSSDILYQNGVAITTDRIKVTNLQFTAIANTYKINLGIEYNNPNGRNEYNASIDLESTACQRE